MMAMAMVMTEQFGLICHLIVPIFRIGTIGEFRIIPLIIWFDHFISLTFVLVGFESFWLISEWLKFLIIIIKVRTLSVPILPFDTFFLGFVR